MVNKLKNIKNYKIIAIMFVIIIILVICLLNKKEFGLSKGVINSSEVKNQAEISSNADVAMGMANIFINTNILMDSGDDLAPLLIQNSEKNNYAQQVDIIDSKTEEVLYSSQIINPGYKIENDYLNVVLESGTHKCIARINFLSLDSYSLINTADILVEIKVK